LGKGLRTQALGAVVEEGINDGLDFKLAHAAVLL
jgi:hypothetical protein